MFTKYPVVTEFTGVLLLYSTYMFLKTNSFLNSSNALVIFSTSAMCTSLHCGSEQLCCPGRTSHQFVVHVYIRCYGNWTETNRIWDFFLSLSLFATPKLTLIGDKRRFCYA